MRKKILVTLTSLLMFAFNTAYASAPQFSAPKQFPTGVYIQPSVSSNYAPTSKPKGLEFYAEFANVPDFAAFAGLLSKDYMFYGTKYSDFFYIDNSSQLFSYSSKVYDYFNVNSAKFAEYKKYLTRIGFKQSDTLALLISPDNLAEYPEEYIEYSDNPRYIDLIKDDILFDPSFVMDLKGVYSIETEYGYTIIVFGDSENYNGGINLTPCKEIRLYNLYFDFDVMGNIMKYADSYLSDLDARTFYLYVPERQAYIPFAADMINTYVRQNDPADYNDDSLNQGMDDYIDRMIRYLGGSQ